MTDATPVVSLDTVDKLRQFDSPTIANVIELFDWRPRNDGFMDGRIESCFPEMPPMVGFAATACFRSAAPPPATDIYGTVDAQLAAIEEDPRPMVMVFQDLDDPPVGATFGEVMCSSYRAFGAVGLVTSGGGRDLAQVRELQFPAFTGSTIVSHAYCHLLHLGAPVRVGGLLVAPGDLLHGDANGVLAVPAEIAAGVAELAEEFTETERIIMDYVKGTARVTVAGYRQRMAQFQQALQGLREKAASLISK